MRFKFAFSAILLLVFCTVSCQNLIKEEKHLFYLHGKILEDQGIRAHSKKYGPYLYNEIIKSFEENGFSVHSEIREKNTDFKSYAHKIVTQIDQLFSLGVPAKNISIVGASKGGFIALEISHKLQLDEVAYVILAACDEDYMPNFSGRVLSIYDKSDPFSKDCRFLAKASGYSRFKEIITDTNLGHGLLYKPHSEWLDPTLTWCKSDSQ